MLKKHQELEKARHHVTAAPSGSGGGSYMTEGVAGCALLLTLTLGQSLLMTGGRTFLVETEVKRNNISRYCCSLVIYYKAILTL
jgi:hypothetical protein